METAVEEQDKRYVWRCTAKRKASLVLSIIKGETSIRQASRQDGLSVAGVKDWKEQFFCGC